MPPFDGADGAAVASSAWARAWQPRVPKVVSAWAEDNRRLSGKSAAEAGPWRNDRIPFLRDIMDALDDAHPCAHVVFIKSSQVGATECALNWVGWTFDESPAPMLALFPTEKLGQRWSRTRLQVMIEETPRLRTIMPPGRRHDNINTLTEKDFPGGHLFIGSANIPTDLASTPIQRLLLDEVDRFPVEIENEGDPVDLAIRRTATWNTRRKIFENSTPTIESLSRINKSWNLSTKHRYHVPCPHCGEMQVLVWANLHWPEGSPKKAHYVCEANGCVIEEHHKTQMLAFGRWVPEFPERDIVGFHINCLYTPIGLGDTWAQNAKEYEKAKGEPSKLKVFQNTRLGETHKDPQEKIEWEEVWLRREPYALRKPGAGVLVLTVGIDVQKDRLALVMWGWGRNEVGTVIDWIEKPGDPTRDELWDWLDEYLAASLDNFAGVPMFVNSTMIDSGYLQHEVTNYCRTRKMRHIFASKGMPQLNRQIIARASYVDVNYRGKTYIRGCEQYPVGVGVAKMVVYNRLRADATKTPAERHFHFSDELPQDFFRQLCAEVFDPNKARGWIKVYERNEVLDCTVLAIAAALHHNTQVHRFKESDWARLEQQLRAPHAAAAAAAEKKELRLSGGFMPIPAKVVREG